MSGVSGQDGSFLVEQLLAKGYEVHGLVRQSTQFTSDKWGHLRSVMSSGQLQVHFGDLTDASRVRNLVEKILPDEIYNLAAQSHVGDSFDQPQNTAEVTALGPLNLLEAIRRSAPKCKFYQASSSEMFGKVIETPQREFTRFHPRSPYGCAKVFGHYITQNYREAYGIYAVSGILFNHESERRGENFVTRKITRAVGRIVAGTQSSITLGNTDAKRDWGYAPDYVDAMQRMMQQPEPLDFVIGTGEVHSVQEFIDAAFNWVGLDPKDFLKTDPRFVRPSEVDTLCADPTLAQQLLGWEPKVRFNELVRRMVDHDVELAKREKAER